MLHDSLRFEFIDDDEAQPRYSLYIPSRGRVDYCFVARRFAAENTEFTLVVEPHELDAYAKVFGRDRCLSIDKSGQGLAYVRNWIKAYSTYKGELFHWQIDDNIKSFILARGDRRKTTPGRICLATMERYVDRFCNVGIAAPIYNSYGSKKRRDVEINKQTASCLLIRNDLPIWFRSGIAEDTDYNMQLLTLDGGAWCSILFNKVLVTKPTTTTIPGGSNDTEFADNGRLKRNKALVDEWPTSFQLGYRNGELRVLPSRVWLSFTQRPIVKHMEVNK